MAYRSIWSDLVQSAARAATNTLGHALRRAQPALAQPGAVGEGAAPPERPERLPRGLHRQGHRGLRAESRRCPRPRGDRLDVGAIRRGLRARQGPPGAADRPGWNLAARADADEQGPSPRL